MSGDNYNITKLMQPNLLTQEELISILHSRCVKIENMGAMSKDQLIDIFHRVITPLEQRLPRRSNPEVRDNENMSQNYDNISVKKIKLNHDLVNGNIAHNRINLKRKNTTECKMENEASQPKKGRQRICWP